VTLDLDDGPGEVTVAWLDILETRWSVPETLEEGGPLPLEAPGRGHWIALVR
jgi:hypothetical protein